MITEMKAIELDSNDEFGELNQGQWTFIALDEHV